MHAASKFKKIHDANPLEKFTLWSSSQRRDQRDDCFGIRVRPRQNVRLSKAIKKFSEDLFPLFNNRIKTSLEVSCIAFVAWPIQVATCLWYIITTKSKKLTGGRCNCRAHLPAEIG